MTSVVIALGSVILLCLVALAFIWFATSTGMSEQRSLELEPPNVPAPPKRPAREHAHA